MQGNGYLFRLFVQKVPKCSQKWLSFSQSEINKTASAGHLSAPRLGCD